MRSLYELVENESLIGFSRGFSVKQLSFNSTVKRYLFYITTS